jgi:hypothetical protein
VAYEDTALPRAPSAKKEVPDPSLDPYRLSHPKVRAITEPGKYATCGSGLLG